MALLRGFLLINVEKTIFVSSNEHLPLALQVSAVFGVCSGLGVCLVNIKLFMKQTRKTQLSVWTFDCFLVQLGAFLIFPKMEQFVLLENMKGEVV